MLRLFLGENQDEKLKRCAAGMKRILESGGKVIAIVPDQFSFAFDKSLYRELGAKDFNSVTVLSFRRFSENLIDRFGTSRGTLISQNDRTVILYLALKKVKASKTLRLLGKSVEKTAFCDEISGLFDSFRRGGVEPSALRAASESLNGTLKDKILDVCDIFEAYTDILHERSLRDESSVISEGAQIAAESRAFLGANVYVDRFDSFSPDELALLGCALKDAESVTVNIPMPHNFRRSAVSQFSHCEMTQNALLNLAEAKNCRVEYLFCDKPKNKNPLISAVGNCLFSPVREHPLSDGSVAAVRADTVYEEAEYVAASIRKLVAEKGYAFNDIAVITHDMESYGSALEAAFERYGIAAFFDDTQSAAGMSLTLYILDAIEAAASSKPDTDKIIKYIRSPFSMLSQEEVSLLWDYCVRWNVDGQMWDSDFTAREEENLELVNAARKKAYEPLKKLHDAAKQSSAKETAAAFCEFLNEVGAAEKAFTVIENCTDSELRLETARLFKQLWNSVMSAISSLYLTAGGEKLTLRAFGELLRLMLSQSSISSPPQKLDSVTVADVSRSVISQPRAAFVVGLSDGAFPADVRKTGIFSGRDIAALESLGVKFDIPPQSRLCAERFDCYKALTAPSELLYLSYSGSDLRGKELRPSRFLRRIRELCGIVPIPASSMGVSFYCSTPASAYYSYAVSGKYTDSEKASVRLALMNLPEWKSKISRLESRNDGIHRLSPEISARLFAPRNINITASRIDVYNRCNYEYFCKFGLKIQPVRPLEVDPANRGTVMHFLFQSVLEYYGESFSEVSDGELKLLIEKLLSEYSEQNLGGDFGKTAKFKADYMRLGEAALEILRNMREEFKVSKFRPVKFEYNLSKENGESVLKIPISGGVSVNIRGVVDRIDVYSAPDGRRYIRVIDYKTGSKKFCFEDIYNGVNLQLLLYMLALTEGSDADFSSCVPSGILYMRAGFLECKDDFDPLDDGSKLRLKRIAEQLKRSGLVVDVGESVEAMDSSFSGLYVPVTRKKDGSLSGRSETVSPESFRLLEEFAKRKAEEFGKGLLNGKIDSVPLGEDSEHLRCAYCDYSSVCDRKKYMYRILEKSDGDILKEIIGVSSKEANEDV